ncbi:hypothetical protein VPH35_082149 [Triticum aestivum]|uniref:Uncharacterized protein n=2 Tax=Triticum TaxID=4564 RepID=A0A9R0WKB1_TRITD|nr:unnamed protein product [Triticum turgidum subsp. durum]
MAERKRVPRQLQRKWYHGNISDDLAMRGSAGAKEQASVDLRGACVSEGVLGDNPCSVVELGVNSNSKWRCMMIVGRRARPLRRTGHAGRGGTARGSSRRWPGRVLVSRQRNKLLLLEEGGGTLAAERREEEARARGGPQLPWPEARQSSELEVEVVGGLARRSGEPSLFLWQWQRGGGRKGSRGTAEQRTGSPEAMLAQHGWMRGRHGGEATKRRCSRRGREKSHGAELTEEGGQALEGDGD